MLGCDLLNEAKATRGLTNHDLANFKIRGIGQIIAYQESHFEPSLETLLAFLDRMEFAIVGRKLVDVSKRSCEEIAPTKRYVA